MLSIEYHTEKDVYGCHTFKPPPLASQFSSGIYNLQVKPGLKPSGNNCRPYISPYLPCLDERYGKPFVERAKFMRRLCKTAGVKRLGLHSIRHLSASILYRKGYSLGHIQAVLRHKNPNTTSRYLKSLGLEQVRDALENGLKAPPGATGFKSSKAPAKVVELKKFKGSAKVIEFRKRKAGRK